MLEILPKSILKNASDQYRRADPFHRWYAWFKYRMDPCYVSVSAYIPPGTLTVDLGTGLGMLPVFLAFAGGNRQSLGVEHDTYKVRSAMRVVAGLAGIQITEGDALEFNIPPCDVVTIVDLLHYYPDEVQRLLLARCARSLRPGGRLLIREGDRRNGGLSGWTRWVEKLSVKLGWNKGSQTSFRPIDDIADDLAAIGFRVSRVITSGRFHPGNVLLVAEVQATDCG